MFFRTQKPSAPSNLRYSIRHTTGLQVIAASERRVSASRSAVSDLCCLCASYTLCEGHGECCNVSERHQLTPQECCRLHLHGTAVYRQIHSILLSRALVFRKYEYSSN